MPELAHVYLKTCDYLLWPDKSKTSGDDGDDGTDVTHCIHVFSLTQASMYTAESLGVRKGFQNQ
jgi:hypothetical protein